MADGPHSAVGHNHECAGLHGKKVIHDVHLNKTGNKADGPEVKPEYGQDLGMTGRQITMSSRERRLSR